MTRCMFLTSWDENRLQTIGLSVSESDALRFPLVVQADALILHHASCPNAYILGMFNHKTPVL